MRKIKFFNKGIKKRCEHCIHSRTLAAGEFICEYKGIVDYDYRCRKYKYDILKRHPRKVRPSDNYNVEDFII